MALRKMQTIIFGVTSCSITFRYIQQYESVGNETLYKSGFLLGVLILPLISDLHHPLPRHSQCKTLHMCGAGNNDELDIPAGEQDQYTGAVEYHCRGVGSCECHSDQQYRQQVAGDLEQRVGGEQDVYSSLRCIMCGKFATVVDPEPDPDHDQADYQMIHPDRIPRRIRSAARHPRGAHAARARDRARSG